MISTVLDSCIPCYAICQRRIAPTKVIGGGKMNFSGGAEYFDNDYPDKYRGYSGIIYILGMTT